ncbi:MAG: 4'-phosphopantetheinyl transferase family protein [Christensenellales bacterium]|jgi:4'-phosphopantetheinyl transferase
MRDDWRIFSRLSNAALAWYNPCMLFDGLVKLYVAHAGADFSYDPARLSHARREKIARIRSSHAQKLSAAAEVALDCALRENIPGYAPPPALFYAPDGRPCVPGAHISLSHAGEIAVCAVARAPVGVDVERADRDLSRLREKIIAPMDDPNRSLIDLWVAKEAYLKLTGEGLSGGMRNYAIDGETVRDARGAVRAHIQRPQLPGYHIAVCQGAPFACALIAVPADL